MISDQPREYVSGRHLAWSHRPGAVWAVDHDGVVWLVTRDAAGAVARLRPGPVALATDEARSQWCVVCASGCWSVGGEDGVRASGWLRPGPCGVALVRDWLWCVSPDGFFQVVEIVSGVVAEQGFVPAGTVCAPMGERVSFRRATVAGLRVVERGAAPGSAQAVWMADLRCGAGMRSSLVLSASGRSTVGLSGRAVTLWADRAESGEPTVIAPIPMGHRPSCAAVGAAGRLLWVGHDTGVSHMDSKLPSWSSRTGFPWPREPSILAIAAEPLGRRAAVTNGLAVAFLDAEGNLDSEAVG